MVEYEIIEDIYGERYGDLVVVDPVTHVPLTGERLARAEAAIERAAVAALKEIERSIGRKD